MTYTDGEEITEEVKPQTIRAGLEKARREHERRLDRWAADGEREVEPEESAEAEAGAEIAARGAVEIHEVHAIAKAWAESNKAR